MERYPSKYPRRKPVAVGSVRLGGDSPVSVQSMISVPSYDLEGSVKQAVALEKAGCEILRAAIPDQDAVRLIPALKKAVSIPIVADIHFDYRLALSCVEQGVDKIRLNPGNIGGRDRVKQVVTACRNANVPIRVGVNGGSLEKEILSKYGKPTAEALVESALGHIRLIEQADYDRIVVSMKSSDVATMIAAYRLMAEQCSYPLHLGVTEAGSERMGTLKSAVGIGSLLCDGIGDTIRVSLTEDPVKEGLAARDLLRALGLTGGVRIVSCPTCGRTRYDMIPLVHAVEDALRDCTAPLTVAVMGCVVNGPGEAREADVGIAGGDQCGILFRKGQIIRKIPADEMLPALLAEVELLIQDQKRTL